MYAALPTRSDLFLGDVSLSELHSLGKELVGFVDVEDYDDLAAGLAARGHDRGAVFHLPELDQ